VQAAWDAQSGAQVALVRVPVALAPKLEVARAALAHLHGLASGPPPGTPQLLSEIVEDESSAVMAIGPLHGASTFDQAALSELHLLELMRQHLTIQIALADAGYHGYLPGAEMVWSEADSRASTFLGWEALATTQSSQRLDLREAARLWYFWATRLPASAEIDVEAELAPWQQLSLGFREICVDAWHSRVPPARLLSALDTLCAFHAQPSESWLEQVGARKLNPSQVRILCDLAERRRIPEDQQRLLADTLSTLTDSKVRHWRQEGDRLLQLGRYSEAAKVFAQLVDAAAPVAPAALRLTAWRRLYCAKGLVELIEERALRLEEAPIRNLETDLLAILHIGDEQRWDEAHDQLKAWRANLPKSISLPSIAVLTADFLFHHLWQGVGRLQMDEQLPSARAQLAKAKKRLKDIPTPYRNTISEIIGDIEQRTQDIELGLARQSAVNAHIEKATSAIDAGNVPAALNEITLCLRAMPQHSPLFEQAAHIAGNATHLQRASAAGLGQLPQKLTPAQRVHALGHLLQLMLQNLDSQWLNKQWDVWQAYCEAMPAAQPEAEILGLLNDYQHLLPQVKRLVETFPADCVAQTRTAITAPDSAPVTAAPQHEQEGVVAPDAQPTVESDPPVAVTGVTYRDVLQLAYDAGRLPQKDMALGKDLLVVDLLTHILQNDSQSVEEVIAALQSGSRLSPKTQKWIEQAIGVQKKILDA